MLSKKIPDLVRHQLEPLRVNQIGFCQGHGQTGHRQESHNGEVFTGLGHDPFVGGYDQEDEIHPGSPGQHVSNKALMARYIHHAEEHVIR